MTKKHKNIYNEDIFTFNYNHDELKDELQIEVNARQQGSMNRPSSDSISPDPYETKIFNFFYAKLSFIKQEIYKKLSIYDKLTNKLSEINQFLAESKYASGDFKHDITTLIQKYKNNIRDIEKELKLKSDDLKNFKSKNNIYREASYPDSKIFHFSIIIFILLIETMLNSYFFAKGSELGLLGGASQAIIISLVNIILAFFLSKIIRYTNIAKVFLKYSAYIMALGILFVVFTFNILVGHLRIYLVESPDTAYRDAITSFKENPFNLSDFNSVILVLIGILIFIIATFDFYKMDDIYPGYGKLDRSYKEILDFHAETKDNLLDELSDMKNKSYRALEDKQKSSKIILKEAQDIPIFRQRMNKQYKVYYSKLNKLYKSMIGEYRNINKQARNDRMPKFFDKIDNLDEDYFIDCLDPGVEEVITELKTKMTEYPHIIGEEKAQINLILKNTVDDLDNDKINLGIINA